MSIQTSGSSTHAPVEKPPLGRCSYKQGGFGALEVIIALFIGILVIIGALAYSKKLNNSSNNTSEMQNISSILMSAKQFRSQGGYGPAGSDLMPFLITVGGIPDSMARNGTTVLNAWDGALSATSTGSGWTMTYADVPDENCLFLAVSVGNSSSKSLSINGGAALVGQINNADATAACTAGTNTLSWTGS